MGRRLSGNGGGGGKPKVEAYDVPTTGGVVKILTSLMGSGSTFALLAADSGVTFNAPTGEITATVAVGTNKNLAVLDRGSSGAGYVRQIRLTGVAVVSKPAAPTVTLAAGNGQIFVGWTDNGDGGAAITAHKVYVDGQLVATIPVIQTSTTLTGLTNGTPYSVQVSAVNSAGEGTKSAAQSATPVAVTIGDVLAVEAVGGTVATDSGFAPDMTGFAVRIKFKGMARRHPVNDSIFNAAAVTLTVTDPGFDNSLTPVTRTRTVKGTLPLKNPFPATWASLPSNVPAKSYCSASAGGTNRAYYTEAGGTKGSTVPSHTTDGQTVSDGGVLWTLVPAATNTGFVEVIDGADVWVYAVLDMPIYAGSTITGVTIGANAYASGGVFSRASNGAGVTLTNGSTLGYPSVIPSIITPAHQRSTGTISLEAVADHGWGIHIGGGRAIAGLKAQAWDMARTTGSAVVAVTDTAPSTFITKTGPGGVAEEVFPISINTSGLPAGDAFVEAEYFPWLGTSFSTRLVGEGADWRASTAYPYVGTIVRNGANFYQLTVAGVSASSGGPTGTTLSTSYTDGTCTWVYIGNDGITRLSSNPQARWHFYNDPANAYKIGYCFVDPSGTATGTTGVFDTFAAADAAKGTLSNCYPTIYAAGVALAAFNNTAASGKTTHNDAGGGVMYLKAGTHAGVGTSMGSMAKGSVWLHAEADPSAAAGSVLFTAGAVKTPHPRMRFGKGITFTATATGTGNIAFDGVRDNTAVVKQITGELWLDGFTANPFDLTQPVAYRAGLVWWTNSTINGYVHLADAATTMQSHYALIAGCMLAADSSASIKTTHILGCTIRGKNILRDISKRIVPAMFTNHRSNIAIGLSATTGGIMIDMFVYDATGNTGYPYLGYSLHGSLIKSSSYAGDKCGQIAADGQRVGTSNVVISYNTFAGQRLNGPYNDSNVALHTQWYRGMNVTTSDNVVWDTSGHGTNLPDGSRCQCYWAVYDVGSTCNVNLNGSESGTAVGYTGYTGLRKAADSTYYALGGSLTFQSQFVSDTTGVTSTANQASTAGDFRPVAGSVIVGKALRQARKYDIAGNLRRTDGSGAVGCYERAA